MNRRNFLYNSAAFAAPLAAARKSASAEPANVVKLGIATYSFCEFQRDLRIANVKKLGIEDVDVKEFHLAQNDSPALLAQGRAQFDKAGLKVIGGGNISHCTAAPIGYTVSFRAELISTGKNRVNFKVQARMGETIVGEGLHQRAAIDVKSLRERVERARQ